MEHQSALKIQRAWWSYLRRKYGDYQYQYDEEEFDEDECRICRSTDTFYGQCLDCLKEDARDARRWGV